MSTSAPARSSASDCLLAGLTTLRLGGPAERLVEAASDDAIVEAVTEADASGGPVLLLGGGSNVVISDAGFAGTVVHVATRGVSASAVGDRVHLVVAAGEPWPELVTRVVADGLAGVECLAGIPGTAGATVIQNVGAYGQQISDAIVSVRAYDRRAARIVDLGRGACGFAYRSSIFRGQARFVVLGVTLELERSRVGRPIAYPELATLLGTGTGVRAPTAEVADAVLELRRRKGMVLDPDDPDSVSAGSFFLNPVLTCRRFTELERRCAELLGWAIFPPAWPTADGEVKVSAAWLIDGAGFARGFGEGRIGISRKHTLALVNRGGGTTTELMALARQIRTRVQCSYGIELEVEPTLVGVAL